MRPATSSPKISTHVLMHDARVERGIGFILEREREREPARIENLPDISLFIEIYL